jgi:hypothetical protein
MASNPKHAELGTYLAVFLSDKTGPRWAEWYALSEDEQRARDETGLAALAEWDRTHKDDIVCAGGPLGPTKRTTPESVEDIVNQLTVFMVVRAASHEAAARLFHDHPHMTIFPCHAVEIMPLIGPA